METSFKLNWGRLGLVVVIVSLFSALSMELRGSEHVLSYVIVAVFGVAGATLYVRIGD